MPSDLITIFIFDFLIFFFTIDFYSSRANKINANKTYGYSFLKNENLILFEQKRFARYLLYCLVLTLFTQVVLLLSTNVSYFWVLSCSLLAYSLFAFWSQVKKVGHIKKMNKFSYKS